MHQSGNTVVAVCLNNYEGLFDAGIGDLSSSKVMITTLSSHSYVDAVF